MGHRLRHHWLGALAQVGHLGSSPARRCGLRPLLGSHAQGYSALVLPQAAGNLDMAPRLDAIDLYPDCRLSKSYEVTWRQLAAVLGTRAPWFHPALRDRDTISAW